MMNGYVVTQKIRKTRMGKFLVHKAFILADNMEQGLELAKAQMPHFPEDGWDILPVEPKQVYTFR